MNKEIIVFLLTDVTPKNEATSSKNYNKNDLITHRAIP